MSWVIVLLHMLLQRLWPFNVFRLHGAATARLPLMSEAVADASVSQPEEPPSPPDAGLGVWVPVSEEAGETEALRGQQEELDLELQELFELEWEEEDDDDFWPTLPSQEPISQSELVPSADSISDFSLPSSCSENSGGWEPESDAAALSVWQRELVALGEALTQHCSLSCEPEVLILHPFWSHTG